MSGRFADAKKTARFVFPGPCGCEGQPHDEDWIEIRTEVGTADWEALPAISGMALVRQLAVSWNLTENGETAPLDEDHLGRLFVDLFETFDDWAAAHIRWSQALPNASGAPSRNGSRASASHTRTTRKST